MMWRPTPTTRYDTLFTFDPNTGKFLSYTNELRFRGRNRFGVDVLGRYDPALGKMSQINTQFDLPLGRSWRFTGLVRYNGYMDQFESRNFQITHEWDCMEASLSYADNPLSFRTGNNQQIFFSIRIKGLPQARPSTSLGVGQALGTGVGDLN